MVEQILLKCSGSHMFRTKVYAFHFCCRRRDVEFGNGISAIRPQLVIVITEVNNLQLDEFLLTVHTNIQSRLADSFSSIRIFRLAGNSLSHVISV
jgi:hypothetical protein